MMMDEYNRGMDPEVKRYFRKIINSFTYGLLWMLSFVTAGLFFGLASVKDGLRWDGIVFYLFALASFSALIYYYVRLWRK